MNNTARKEYYDEKTLEVLAQCKSDIGTYLKVFHPDTFSRPWGPGHKELFTYLNNPERPQKTLIVAHRGFGKTKIFNFGIPSHGIVMGGDKFIVPVSASNSHAVMQANILRRHLQTEPACKEAVGDIKSASWASDCWITSNDCMVLPRGAEQQIRGILHDIHRPTSIIVDDLEKSESVLNPEQRSKLKNWFYADLMGSIDRSKNNWRTLVAGTILHEDSLLQHLRDEEGWNTIEFPLCDENFNTLWPEYMSTEAVKALREEYVQAGMIETFYMEYMNIANPREDAVFKPEYFQYYTEGDPGFEDLNEWENIVLVDPAKTVKTHSDFTAICGIAWQPEKGRVVLRDCINERLHPDEIYKKTFEMCARLNAQVLAVETTSLNEFILQPLEDAMFTHGLAYELVELKAKKGDGDLGGKAGRNKGRIRALSPYFRTGKVFLNRACSAPLEQQLLAYPRAKHDDVADCFSYFIQLLHLGGRNFELAPAPGYVRNERDPEDEFRALEEGNLEPIDLLEYQDYSVR